jgi:hypothetical protein
MPRLLQILRVIRTGEGWLLRGDDSTLPRETFNSKQAAISAGVRLALRGGYVVVTHQDGRVETVLSFCEP